MKQVDVQTVINEACQDSRITVSAIEPYGTNRGTAYRVKLAFRKWRVAKVTTIKQWHDIKTAWQCIE